MLPPPDPKRESGTPQDREQEERRRQLLKLLAEIEKRINEENARPRKRYISPATREEVYAVYYDELRRRIEERGTANFPEIAGRKLYGELTMVITVNHDGKVLDTEVVQGSGQNVLDNRAQAIVRGLNFGRFNEAMRRRADQIVVVSRFRFTRDETLQTQLSTQ
jgi:protein TonB